MSVIINPSVVMYDISDLPPFQLERFWSKVKKSNNCWIWTAAKLRGYGVFNINKKQRVAHRISYEMFKGDIPADLELDHLCRNRDCVNPEHLEAVTHLENVRRGIPYRTIYHKTHCKYGHEFTLENTRFYKDERVCRTCNKIRLTKRRLKGKCN